MQQLAVGILSEFAAKAAKAIKMNNKIIMRLTAVIISAMFLLESVVWSEPKGGNLSACKLAATTSLRQKKTRVGFKEFYKLEEAFKKIGIAEKDRQLLIENIIINESMLNTQDGEIAESGRTDNTGNEEPGMVINKELRRTAHVLQSKIKQIKKKYENDAEAVKTSKRIVKASIPIVEEAFKKLTESFSPDEHLHNLLKKLIGDFSRSLKQFGYSGEKYGRKIMQIRDALRKIENSDVTLGQFLSAIHNSSGTGALDNINNFVGFRGEEAIAGFATMGSILINLDTIESMEGYPNLLSEFFFHEGAEAAAEKLGLGGIHSLLRLLAVPAFMDNNYKKWQFEGKDIWLIDPLNSKNPEWNLLGKRVKQGIKTKFDAIKVLTEIGEQDILDMAREINAERLLDDPLLKEIVKLPINQRMEGNEKLKGVYCRNIEKHAPVYFGMALKILQDPANHNKRIVFIGRAGDLLYDAALFITKVFPEYRQREKDLFLVDFSRDIAEKLLRTRSKNPLWIRTWDYLKSSGLDEEDSILLVDELKTENETTLKALTVLLEEYECSVDSKVLAIDYGESFRSAYSDFDENTVVSAVRFLAQNSKAWPDAYESGREIKPPQDTEDFYECDSHHNWRLKYNYNDFLLRLRNRFALYRAGFRLFFGVAECVNSLHMIRRLYDQSMQEFSMLMSEAGEPDIGQILENMCFSGRIRNFPLINNMRQKYEKAIGVTYRAFVFDLDATILSQEVKEQIQHRLIKKIAELTNKGIIVTLATANSYENISGTVIEQLIMAGADLGNLFILGENGNELVNADIGMRNEKIEYLVIPEEYGDKLKELKIILGNADFKYTSSGCITVHNGKNNVDTSALCNNFFQEEGLDLVAYWNGYEINIHRKAVSKARIVDFLKQEFGISSEEVVSFDDMGFPFTNGAPILNCTAGFCVGEHDPSSGQISSQLAIGLTGPDAVFKILEQLSFDTSTAYKPRSLERGSFRRSVSTPSKPRASDRGVECVDKPELKRRSAGNPRKKPVQAMKELGRRNRKQKEEIMFTEEELRKLVRKGLFDLIKLEGDKIEIGDGRTAGVLYLSNKKLKGYPGHNFEIDGKIYIVINKEMPVDVRDECLFHELREVYWLKKINDGSVDITDLIVGGFKVSASHAAHIIACAEQVLKFSIDMRKHLTSYHEMQINSGVAAELEELIDEDEEERNVHHKIISAAGIDLEKVKKYESRLRLLAEEKMIREIMEQKSEGPRKSLNSIEECRKWIIINRKLAILDLIDKLEKKLKEIEHVTEGARVKDMFMDIAFELQEAIDKFVQFDAVAEELLKPLEELKSKIDDLITESSAAPGLAVSKKLKDIPVWHTLRLYASNNKKQDDADIDLLIKEIQEEGAKPYRRWLIAESLSQAGVSAFNRIRECLKRKKEQMDLLTDVMENISKRCEIECFIMNGEDYIFMQLMRDFIDMQKKRMRSSAFEEIVKPFMEGAPTKKVRRNAEFVYCDSSARNLVIERPIEDIKNILLDTYKRIKNDNNAKGLLDIFSNCLESYFDHIESDLDSMIGEDNMSYWDLFLWFLARHPAQATQSLGIIKNQRLWQRLKESANDERIKDFMKIIYGNNYLCVLNLLEDNVRASGNCIDELDKMYGEIDKLEQVENRESKMRIFFRFMHMLKPESKEYVMSRLFHVFYSDLFRHAFKRRYRHIFRMIDEYYSGRNTIPFSERIEELEYYAPEEMAGRYEKMVQDIDRDVIHNSILDWGLSNVLRANSFKRMRLHDTGQETELFGEKGFVSNIARGVCGKELFYMSCEENTPLEEFEKQNIRSKLEPYRVFLKANFSALALIKESMTIADLMQVIGYLESMIKSYVRFTENIEYEQLRHGEIQLSDETKLIIEQYYKIRKRIFKEIGELRLKGIDVLPPGLFGKISSLENNREINENTQLHALINYVHQRGFRGLFGQYKTHYNVDTYKRYYVINKNNISKAKSGSFGYTNVTEGKNKPHSLVGLFEDTIADIPNANMLMVNADVISLETLAMFKISIGEHSLEVFSQLAPPSEGGTLVVEYREAEHVMWCYGGKKRLKIVGKFLENAGFKLDIDMNSGFVRAVMDNSNAGTVSDIENGFKAIMHVINISTNLDLPFDDLLQTRYAPLIKPLFEELCAAFKNERVFLPAQVLHKLLWRFLEKESQGLSDKQIQTMLGIRSENIVMRANKYLKKLGLPLIPQDTAMTQEVYNRYISNPIKEGLAIGRFKEDDKGEIIVVPGFKEETPTNFLINRIFNSNSEETAKIILDMYNITDILTEPKLQKYLVFRPIAKINSYIIQEAKLDIIGSVVTFFVIRHPTTEEILIAGAVKGKRPNNLNVLSSEVARDLLYCNGYPVNRLNSRTANLDLEEVTRLRKLLSQKVSDYDVELESGVRGLPVSSGVAVGKLIIDRPRLTPKDTEGKILAGKYFNVFDAKSGVAAGILTLRGSTLSHPAIVARESGVPAVTDIRDAELLDDRIIVRYESFTDEDIVTEVIPLKSGEGDLNVTRVDKITEETLVVEEGDLVYMDANSNIIKIYKKGTTSYGIFELLRAYSEGDLSCMEKLGGLLGEAACKNDSDALTLFMNILFKTEFFSDADKRKIYEYASDNEDVEDKLLPLRRKFCKSLERECLNTFQKVMEQISTVRTFAEYSALLAEYEISYSRFMFIKELFGLKRRGDPHEEICGRIKKEMGNKLEQLKNMIIEEIRAFRARLNINNAAHAARCLDLAQTMGVEEINLLGLRGRVREIIEADERRKRHLFVIPLSEAGGHLESLIGGKAANLCELAKLMSALDNTGFSMKDGWVVTTNAYEFFINQKVEFQGAKIKLKNVIKAILRDKDIEDKHAEIEKYFLQADIPRKVVSAIPKNLVGRYAIRSSAVGEDNSQNSFAGQMDTFLCVDACDIACYLKRVWASLYTNRAIDYRTSRGLKVKSHAVIIQEMADSEKSGVIYTTNTVDGNYNQLLIDGVIGLGEGFVGNKVPSDLFIVRKHDSFTIDKQVIRDKNRAIVYDEARRCIVEENTADGLRERPLLTSEQIKELAGIAMIIEDHYGYPQDIEWALCGNKIYILQTRPITNLMPKDKAKMPRYRRPDVQSEAYRRRVARILGIGGDAADKRKRRTASMVPGSYNVPLSFLLNRINDSFSEEQVFIDQFLNDTRWLKLKDLEYIIFGRIRDYFGLFGITDGYDIKLEQYLLGEGKLKGVLPYTDKFKPGLLLLNLIHEAAHRKINFPGLLDEIVALCVELEFFLKMPESFYLKVRQEIEETKIFIAHTSNSEEYKMRKIALLDKYYKCLLLRIRAECRDREKMTRIVLDYLSTTDKYADQVKELIMGDEDKKDEIVRYLKLYFEAVDGDKDAREELLNYARQIYQSGEFQAVTAGTDNIGKNTGFIVDRENRMIKIIDKNTGSEIAKAPYEKIEKLDEGNIISTAQNLKVSEMDGFTDCLRQKLSLGNIMVFEGNDNSRATGAFAHAGGDGVVYIDTVLAGNSMAVIHEIIHLFLREKTKLMRDTGVEYLKKLISDCSMDQYLKDKISHEAEGFIADEEISAILIHYYARYYLQNNKNGQRYADSANERLTYEIRLNASANVLGIDKQKLQNLLERKKLEIGIRNKLLSLFGDKKEAEKDILPKFFSEFINILKGEAAAKGFDTDMIRDLVLEIYNMDGYYVENGRLKQSLYFQLMLEWIKMTFNVSEQLISALDTYKYIDAAGKNGVKDFETMVDNDLNGYSQKTELQLLNRGVPSKRNSKEFSSALCVYKEIERLLDREMELNASRLVWQEGTPLVVDAKHLIGKTEKNPDGSFSIEPLGEGAVWLLRNANKTGDLFILYDESSQGERDAVSIWLKEHGIELQQSRFITEYPKEYEFAVGILCREREIPKTHRVICGAYGKGDMMLISRIAAILGSRDIENPKDEFRILYKLYYRDRLSEEEIERLIAKIITAVELGKVIELPPILPFIEIYLNIFSETREIVSTAA